MATNRGVLKLAAKIAKQYEAGYEAYLEECEAYQADGYRPARCEHGTSQWTDYDNICGPCEDGLTFGDPLYRRKRALENAHDRWDAATRVFEAVDAMRTAGLDGAVNMEPVWDEIRRLLMTSK